VDLDISQLVSFVGRKRPILRLPDVSSGYPRRELTCTELPRLQSTAGSQMHNLRAGAVQPHWPAKF